MNQFLAGATLSLSILAATSATAEDATNGLTVINKGANGTSSTSARERFERDVVALKPDYVLIYAGINDVINDHFFAPLDVVIANLQGMIEAARAAGIKPVICSLHHVDEVELYKHHPREKFGNETVNQKLDRYNAAIRKLAADQRVPLADFFAVTDRADPKQFRSTDGVHLTPAGNRLLAQTFLDAIGPKLKGNEKIVCLGDSLTFGHGNEGAGTTDGDTYPAALRRLPLEKKERGTEK